MKFARLITIFLALMNAGFMTYDGMHAFITGDYIRPATGEYAGQLGPWTNVTETLGIDPLSTLMKSIFVIYGLVGLYITFSFIRRKPWARKGLIVFNILALWYFFVGTLSSVVQITLLVLYRPYNKKSQESGVISQES